MDILVKAFNAFVKRKTEFIKKRYAFYKSQNNTIVVKDYANQFPFLKSRDQLPGLDEILKWKYTKDIFNFDEHISPILNYFISKITGLYKHGQTEKTGLCNLRILSNIKAGKLTFAISKNTLSAKEQWESRLINSLKKEYPGTPLKNLILIISSKVNDLGGNATHCKSVEEAYFKFASGFIFLYFCVMKAIKRKSDCPINFALEIFGDKWTFLIVRDLMFKGKHFYGEFLLSEEGIATNILSNRLSLLESNGIISKSSDPSHKQKIIYRLTRKGIDLVPLLVEFIMWSAKYDKDSAVDMKFVKSVKRDKGGMLSQITSSLVDELGVS